MKRDTVKLLFWTALAYTAVLIIVRGVLPPNSTPATSLIAIPLLILAVIIIRDMALRSTSHSETVDRKDLRISKGRQVELLSHQIDVTANASASYFDSIVRARLIGLLVKKASLESGLARKEVLEVMSDEKERMRFLKNDALYKLLYSPIPKRGRARIAMIRKAVDLIEALNP